ncbi:MAG: hypothetical protein V3R78_09990 [Thermodesulfobacteriota bacterium]
MKEGVDEMKTKDILHILRNPYGQSQGQTDSARIEAADLIEKLEKANLDWCRAATARGEGHIHLEDSAYCEGACFDKEVR